MCSSIDKVFVGNKILFLGNLIIGETWPSKICWNSLANKPKFITEGTKVKHTNITITIYKDNWNGKYIQK